MFPNRRSGQGASLSDDGSASEAEEARFEDEPEQRDDEEEDDGEDLLGDGFERDYAERPELDTYDMSMLDERRYGDISRKQKEMAERELQRRDKAAGAEGRRGMFDSFSEDGMSSVDGFEARRARHHDRRARRADLAVRAGEGLSGMDQEDYDLQGERLVSEDDLTSTEHLRLRNKIRANFMHFLATFKEENAEDERLPFYSRVLQDILNGEGAELASLSMELKFGHLRDNSPVLAKWLADFPVKILPILDEAALEYAIKHSKNFAIVKNREIIVRVVEFPVSDTIRDLRGFHLNRLVRVVGVVTKRTSVMPRLRNLFLDCARCSYVLGPFQVSDGLAGSREVRPGMCPECSSKGPFVVNRDETVYRDYQKITVQEPPGSMGPGKTPRSKEAILTGDLVDCVRPGDLVDVHGVYRTLYDNRVNVQAGFPVFSTLLEVNSIGRKNELKKDCLTDEDREKIRALARDRNIRQRIIASVAPSIYGENNVKLAVLMSMFGGVAKTAASGHRIRGDINTLILGDPGLAKSQFLKYVDKTFYRTMFTSGKGASAVGLTAAVRKRRELYSGRTSYILGRDHESGDWVLEGGAMVLADGGICLIDEFDKMNDQDRTSIHEAMEQQSISISKAGIVASLSAKCAVIAAANPIGGRYDPQLTFEENVDLTDPILSRFDVMCVLRDEVDVTKDELLAGHVVTNHMKSHLLGMIEEEESQEPSEEVVVPQYEEIPQSLLQKYILYARHEVHPKLANVDVDKLASFYKEIRQAAQETQGVKMTVRHVESMIRLAEASARMELRNDVRPEDVNHAIAVMLESFIQTQKYQVADRLRKKFEKKYIISTQEHAEVVKHLLCQMYRREYARHNIQLEARIEDETLRENVKVTLDNLIKECERYDIPRNSVNDFLRSKVFKEMGFDVKNNPNNTGVVIFKPFETVEDPEETMQD